MLQTDKTLYWFTPFFTRMELTYFISQCSSENCKAFFCFDPRWNRISMEDLQYLKNELQNRGVHLILIEGNVEKVVPSVARVLKAGRVICSRSENHSEFQPVIHKICRDLELHSIAFCDQHMHHYTFYNGGEHSGIRQTI